MRVITLNLNGIRSAARKGFFEWLSQQEADVVCLQEIRAQEQDLTDKLFYPEGYHAYYHCAHKKGYAGVAVYSKHKPKEIILGLGEAHFDQEGRYVALDLGKVTVASLYLPSGTSGEHRQTVKYKFLDFYANYLNQHKHKDFIICGDLNIAHKEIDLKNWRNNRKHSGFLPEERAWLDRLFTEMGFVDAFRVVNPEPDQYTWWSNRGQAWLKNVGWRIDYQVVSSSLKPTIKSANIYKNQRFSDHAPLLMDYDIIL